MSSLAAACADGYYRPDSWDIDRKKKHIEKKREMGILKDRKFGSKVCRFEVPFHIRCDACKVKISKGVRFDAQKTKVGKYLGTDILLFKFACPSCFNIVGIRTNPKDCEYDLAIGCLKFEQDWDYLETGAAKIQDPEEGKNLQMNLFLAAEMKAKDIGENWKNVVNIENLIKEREKYKDLNYVNDTLMKQWKLEKNEIFQKQKEIKNIQLTRESYEKKRLSEVGNTLVGQERMKMKNESIFANKEFLGKKKKRLTVESHLKEFK